MAQAWLRAWLGLGLGLGLGLHILHDLAMFYNISQYVTMFHISNILQSSMAEGG